MCVEGWATVHSSLARGKEKKKFKKKSEGKHRAIIWGKGDNDQSLLRKQLKPLMHRDTPRFLVTCPVPQKNIKGWISWDSSQAFPLLISSPSALQHKVRTRFLIYCSMYRASFSLE